MWGTLALSLALLASPALAGGDKYWWMNQQDVFSGRNGNSNSGGHRNQQFQQGGQQSSYPNNNNQNFGGPNDVETQCPAGTKCVSEFFCDENAVMVNYRVDLTPAQIRNRGELLVRLLGPLCTM